MSEVKQPRSCPVQGQELDLNDPSASIPIQDICSSFTDNEVYKVKNFVSTS